MSRLVVGLLDGTLVRGEYVGAADGYIYLSDGDDVRRVEQRLILNMTTEVPDAE